MTQAMDLFQSIRKKLGEKVDARIITTDVTPTMHYSPLDGYDMTLPCENDCINRDIIADAAQRFRYPFFMRDSDVLMATTWWTALSVLDILKQQDRLFGQRNRRFLYFIQGFECSNFAWSTQHALAEQSYLHADVTIPVFNSTQWYDYFKKQGYFNEGYVVSPGKNPDINAASDCVATKENIVLLPIQQSHEKSCLALMDVFIQTLIDNQPQFWEDWRFIVVGVGVKLDLIKICQRIEVLEPYSIHAYSALASRAKLGLWLGFHPPYGEMFSTMLEAGVKIMINERWKQYTSLLDSYRLTYSSLSMEDMVENLTEIAQVDNNP
jgi:hypothetical protein